MINERRRDAFILLSVMGVVSASAAIIQRLPYRKVVTAKIDLDEMFPSKFDAWRVDEAARAFVRPTLEQGKQYGLYDQVLERTFVNDEGERVMLSVAYGSEQSGTLELHRPELCYPYNGYQVFGLQIGEMDLAGRNVPVINVLAEMPGRFEPITYWIVIGGELVTRPRAQRWQLLSFAVRRQLPDGLLIRISSINANPKAAFDLHHQFADSMVRAMSPAHRAQVIGSALRS